MKVYVLETGLYDERDIHGVYATADAAMEAWQPDRPEPPQPLPEGVSRVYDAATRETREASAPPAPSHTWRDNGNGTWTFDGGLDAAAGITEYELQGAPLRA